MGSIADAFPSTHLSLLHAAAETGGEARLVALGCFIERYRPCLCRVLERRLGVPEYDAENLVHDFIIAKVLEGELIRKYFESSRRRFRYYLAFSLRNFAIDKLHRRKGLLERELDDEVIGMSVLSISEVEMALVRESLQELLIAVFRRVRGHYIGDNKLQHWNVFFRRFVEPALTGRDPVSYADIAKQLGLESTKTACNLATTVLREFRRVWCQLLLQDYGNDAGELQAVLVDFRDCLTQDGLIDVRHLVLHAGLSESGDYADYSSEGATSCGLLDLLEGRFDALTDLEKEMLWRSYLGTPIYQFSCDEELRSAPESSANSSVDGSSQTLADFLQGTLPSTAVLARLKRCFGNMVTKENSAVPREVAAVLRLYVVASASVKSRVDLSRGSQSRTKHGVQRALQYSWLDDGTRALFKEYLEKVKQ